MPAWPLGHSKAWRPRCIARGRHGGNCGSPPCESHRRQSPRRIHGRPQWGIAAQLLHRVVAQQAGCHARWHWKPVFCTRGRSFGPPWRDRCSPSNRRCGRKGRVQQVQLRPCTRYKSRLTRMEGQSGVGQLWLPGRWAGDQPIEKWGKESETSSYAHRTQAGWKKSESNGSISFGQFGAGAPPSKREKPGGAKRGESEVKTRPNQAKSTAK